MGKLSLPVSHSLHCTRNGHWLVFPPGFCFFLNPHKIHFLGCSMFVITGWTNVNQRNSARWLCVLLGLTHHTAYTWRPMLSSWGSWAHRPGTMCWRVRPKNKRWILDAAWKKNCRTRNPILGWEVKKTCLPPCDVIWGGSSVIVTAARVISVALGWSTHRPHGHSSSTLNILSLEFSFPSLLNPKMLPHS